MSCHSGPSYQVLYKAVKAVSYGCDGREPTFTPQDVAAVLWSVARLQSVQGRVQERVQQRGVRQGGVRRGEERRGRGEINERQERGESRGVSGEEGEERGERSDVLEETGDRGEEGSPADKLRLARERRDPSRAGSAARGGRGGYGADPRGDRKEERGGIGERIGGGGGGGGVGRGEERIGHQAARRGTAPEGESKPERRERYAGYTQLAQRKQREKQRKKMTESEKEMDRAREKHMVGRCRFTVSKPLF